MILLPCRLGFTIFSKARKVTPVPVRGNALRLVHEAVGLMQHLLICWLSIMVYIDNIDVLSYYPAWVTMCWFKLILFLVHSLSWFITNKSKKILGKSKTHLKSSLSQCNTELGWTLKNCQNSHLFYILDTSWAFKKKG